MLARHTALAFALLVVAGCGARVAPDGSGANDGGSGGASPDPPRPATSSCALTRDCPHDEYCDRGGSCGTGGTRGTCKPIPGACPDIYGPTCACDGKTYDNPCFANAAGVDVSSAPICGKKGGQFGCGSIVCDAASTYCRRTYNDVVGPGQPREWDTCEPLPESCRNTTSCTCFPSSVPCASLPNMCKPIATAGAPSYGFEVTCPGG